MTAKQFRQQIKRSLLESGKSILRAKHDDAGNCIYCGEAGRCPGYHDRENPRKLYALLAGKLQPFNP